MKALDAIDLGVTPTPPPKKKRIRRWAKRPTDPNYNANVFLSVRDVHLILRELESYAKRIEGVRGFAIERRFVLRLIEKLRVVKWSPPIARGK